MEGGATVNWTTLPSVFPSGMAHFQKDVLHQIPLVLHNRHWSMHSDYIRNWTDLPWYSGPGTAIPVDSAAFFTRFFTQQQQWGLSMYEQDWMCTQYDTNEALQTNISLADLWLQGMAIGAASQNLTIQYCMPYANQILAAVGRKEVTNARATGDYWPSTNQWTIGGTSMFYWALGILPFKDGFFSSNLPQTGCLPKGPELRPNLQALMSTLSGAMVGVMDGIYLMNLTRVMHTCRKDGVILKPDRPVVVSDACFYKNPQSRGALVQSWDPASCFVYLTHSDIKGLGRVIYLFQNDTHVITPFLVAHLEAYKSSSYAVYNWYTREVHLLDNSTVLSVTPGYEGHSYCMLTPIMGTGWIFIGEVDKYVTASRKRIDWVSLSDDEQTLDVQVQGVSGEEIQLCVSHLSELKLICSRVGFEETTTKQRVTFHASRATSLFYDRRDTQIVSMMQSYSIFRFLLFVLG